jgi:hypothetical protein
MQRRNFLQALFAAGSALAGAKAVTAAVAVTANTKPLRRNLDEAQRTVMEMLKECRVLNLEKSVDIRAASSWRVTYRHGPDAPRTSLDDEADQIIESRAPVSVSVSSYQHEVDIVSLGGSFYRTTLTKPTYEIKVEYR